MNQLGAMLVKLDPVADGSLAQTARLNIQPSKLFAVIRNLFTLKPQFRLYRSEMIVGISCRLTDLVY